jgi:hypothetical protein
MVFQLLEKAICLLLGLFMVLMGGAAGVQGLGRLRKLALATKRPSKGEGWQAIQGMARATSPGEIQISPLTGVLCVAYRLSIVERVAASKGSGGYVSLYLETRGQWNLSLDQKGQTIPLQSAELDVDRAYFQDSQHPLKDFRDSRSKALLDEKAIPAKGLGMRRSIHIQEFIIRQGDPIRVVGELQQENGAPILNRAIVTDKPSQNMLIETLVMILVSGMIAYIGLALVFYALR